MNEIEIDITITMGETCSNTMSLNEARILYLKLGDLFSLPDLKKIKEQVTSSGSPSDSKVEEKVKSRAAETMSNPNSETIKGRKVEETSEQFGSRNNREKTSPANLKVEAAKERARKRTSSCGSR